MTNFGGCYAGGRRCSALYPAGGAGGCADELETIFYFAHLDAGLKADLSLDQMKLLMRILDDAALGDFMDIEPSFIHRSDRALFVAVSPNNEPFGMTAVTRLNDDSAEIQRVAVDPTRQGAGAAKALMRQCIEHAVARWADPLPGAVDAGAYDFRHQLLPQDGLRRNRAAQRLSRHPGAASFPH